MPPKVFRPILARGALSPDAIADGFAAWTGARATVCRWGIDKTGRLDHVVLETAESGGLVRPECGSALTRPILKPSSLAWEQPGWMAARHTELKTWLDTCGFGDLTSIRQIRHGPLGAVLRLETGTGAVFWYKESLPLFAREPRVLHMLAERSPRASPRLLAQLSNGHVTADIDIAEANHPRGWWQSLGDIHAASMGWGDELHAAGVPELTVNALRHSLMQLPDSAACNTPRMQALLASHHQRLDRALDVLDQLNVPDVLIHGDLHPENSLQHNDGWTFLDWTDCLRANPFLDLALVPRYWPHSFEGALMHFATLWGGTPHGDTRILAEAVCSAGVARLLYQYRLIHDATDARYRDWATYRMADWLDWLAEDAGRGGLDAS